MSSQSEYYNESGAPTYGFDAAGNPLDEHGNSVLADGTTQAPQSAPAAAAPAGPDVTKADLGQELSAQRGDRAGYEADLAAARAAAGASPAITGATIDHGPQGQFRNDQSGLIQSYQGVLSGSAPSVAQIQSDRALAQNIAGQMSAAASARGPNLAAARRIAAMNAGQLGAISASDSAQLRAKEISDARAGLGGVLQGARSQDLALAGEQATLTQGAQTANQQSSIASRGQDIAQQAGLRGDINQANSISLDADKAEMARQMQKSQQENDLWKSLLTGGLSAAGTIGAAAVKSDRRSKTDIAPDDSATMAEFLRSIDPSSWRYKDDAPGTDRHGPMAQDLERSRVGRSMVVDTPGGKMIHIPSAVTALLNAVGFLGREREAKVDAGPVHETIAMVRPQRRGARG